MTLDRHREDLASNPENTRAFEALQEHFFLEGEWDELLLLYQRRLEAPSLRRDPELQVPILFRMGQILDERCSESDRAVETYWKVAKLNPQFRPALQQLRQIHARREQWDMVLQIAEIEDRAEMNAYDRASFLAEMGQVWLHRLDDPDEATGCFERALEADPEQQTALEGLALSQQARGHPEQAARLWERLVGVLRGPERAPALVSLGKLFAGPLQQTKQASQCFRRAMADDPRSEDAVESLIVIVGAQEQWELLGDLYERRFDLASGARRRSAIALEAGHMQLERLGNPEMARRWFDRAHELVEEDVSVHHALAELARSQGDDVALLRSLDRVIELSGQAAPVSVLLEAADLHGEKRNNSEALQYLEQAQRRSPDDPLVLEALTDALTSSGQSSRLADVLERRAALCNDDPEAQAESLRDLGRIYEDDLGDSEAAIAALSRAFDANPQLADVSDRLQQLYGKAERWEELRDLLQRARGQASPADRPACCCALGDVLLEHFDDLEGAQSAFQTALDLDPAAPAALRGLERVARESGDAETILTVCEREASTTGDPERLEELVWELLPLLAEREEPERALGWIEKLLDATGENRRVLEAAAQLQGELGRTPDLERSLQRLDPLLHGAAQAANRRQLAELASQLGDDDAAIAHLESAVDADPTDREALCELKHRYEAAHELLDVARVQRRLADALPPAERAACLDELASLLEKQLGDVEAAIVVLWRLCGMPERPASAPERLETLLERTGRFEELAQQLLERRRTLADESDDAEELDLRRARLLLDKLGQVEEAASIFRRIRGRNPGCREATEGLEQALRSGNDSAGLVLLLESRARNASDASVRVHIEFERAVILEESLGEQESAKDLYTELADQTDDISIATMAAVRIERLLERCGDWETLRQRLEQALGKGSSEDDLQLHERLAALCRSRLADREGCIEHLESIGRLKPDRAETWRSLAQLYQELGRQADALRAFEAEIECHPQPERKLVLHARSAGLCTECAGLSEPADSGLLVRAREHYERVLELDATHSEASEFLIDRYESEDRPADVVRLLRLRLDATGGRDTTEGGDPNQRTSLQLRIADRLADRLNDLDGAIEVLEQVLSEVGPVGLVSEPLAELYERAGAGEQLAELCRQASGSCDAAAERAGWLVRLGRVRREAGKAREASEAYCEALVDRPGDREIEAILRDLYRELAESQPLASLLESEIRRLTPAEQVPLRLELAELLAGPLERPEEVLSQLQQILELEPEHAEAFDAAMALSERLDHPEDILRLLDTRLDGGGGAIARAELLERRGDLLAGALDRPEEAASAYREAMTVEPDRQSARRALCGVLERLERWPAVLDCLHLEACASEDQQRSDVLERAAEIARQHVSSDAQLPWLERLRVERPDDPDVVARMADVHRQAGRPEALLRALELELSLVSDSHRKRNLQMQRARVLERDLQAPGRAITAYETARTLAPDDAEVLRELDRLYDLMGRARERVDVLEALVELAEPEERISLHSSAATISSTVHSEPGRAIAHLLAAVSLCRTTQGEDERFLQILRELEESLRAAGRVDSWVRAAEAELRALTPQEVETRPRRAELHSELADAYGKDLGLPDAALRHLRALLALAEDAKPGSEDILSPDRLEQAELELTERLRASRSRVALARQLEHRLERGQGEAEEWLELARLRAESLHAPAAAARAYREVLARQPSCLAAIRGLRHVAECLQDWSEVAHSLELELGLADRWSPRELLALHRRLGDVCRHRLQEPERAAEAFRAALDALPGDLDTLRSLQDLLQQRELWSEVLDLSEHEIEILADRDPERRHALWLRIARIADQQTPDRRRALRAFESAAQISPLGGADQRSLAELYRTDGDIERFAETFAHWCDDPEADASGWDQLSLVAALEELGRVNAALERALVAVERDESNTEAWETLARLREQQGDPDGAAEALERAADLHEPAVAAQRLVQASGLREAADAEAAARLLERASERDPGRAEVHAELARVAEGLGRFEAAEEAAGRALDLAPSQGGALDPERRLSTALVGGRAARERQHLEEAARFFRSALELDPDHREALDAQGEVLFELGEYSGARKLLQARLDMGGDNPRRAWQLAAVARGLEHEGDPTAALTRYREALGLEASLAIAHQRIVGIQREAGQNSLTLDALELWIRNDPDPASRAESRLGAAEILLEESNLEAAEAHLREALSDDANLQLGWVLLSELLLDLDRTEEALDTGDRALEHVGDPELRARISLIRGRILDSQEQVRRAAEAYAEAARGDPRCTEAALAEARLLRSTGDWYAAADALGRFITGHPEPDSLALAQVHLERGRLMAGPLENVREAIGCYERALELEPDLDEARKPLAALLAHVPERWQDAVLRHRELLGEDPTRQSSLRALLEISRRRDLEGPTQLGLAVLRALGSASPEEATYAPDSFPADLHAAPQLDDPDWETARRICHIAAQEIGEVLTQSGLREPTHAGGQSLRDFWRRVGEEEAKLAAPGLCWLDDEDLNSIVYTVTALAADPGGNCNDGPYLYPLDQAIGRWTRRKIRKALGTTTVREIQSIDYQGWREQIRRRAACAVLNESDGDLRTGLIALASADSDEDWTGPTETADITALVAGSGLARRLLTQALDAWCSEITK